MKKEQQIYVAIGLGFVFFIFVYFVFLLGSINKSISLKIKKIEEKKNLLVSIKKEAAAIDELRMKSEVLQKEVTDLQTRLPKSKDIPGLLRTLTENAQRFGIKISNIQPGQLVSQKEYDELIYTLTIASNFHNLGHFLAEMGQEKRIFSFRNLKLNVQSGTDKNITVNGTVDMVTYIGRGS